MIVPMTRREDRRRELGAWYTPHDLVAHVVANTIPPVVDGTVTVLDPACGDGRFLVEAGNVVRARGGEPVLIGVDVDPDAIASASRHPELRDARFFCADALDATFLDDLRRRDEHIDVVVGNPPFLSPLSARVLADDRRRAVASPGGAYADAAVRFLDLATRIVRADGGRVGLVLPVSVLASRDARVVRRSIMSTSEMLWFWWSPSPVFDAAVVTCAIGFERVPDPVHRQRVTRAIGPTMSPAGTAPAPLTADDGWGELIADDLGIPTVEGLSTVELFGDHCRIAADFRDQYYGIIDALVDIDPDIEPPPGFARLVTTALIDPGRCLWGTRAVRYGKRRWNAPAVTLSSLDERMQTWAATRLVPKVMVATQTAVVEAVADPSGSWLPAVPIVSVMPLAGSKVSVEEIAAVLTSPVPSALIARRAAGTGLSATVVRVTARHLAALPWPSGRLDAAVSALRSGDCDACADEVSIAYGVNSDDRMRLMQWWQGRRRN
jgi:hypothetical protein